MTDNSVKEKAREGREPVKEKAQEDREKMKERNDEVVVASDDSFPASDPPSWTGVTGPSDAKKKGKRH